MRNIGGILLFMGCALHGGFVVAQDQSNEFNVQEVKSFKEELCKFSNSEICAPSLKKIFGGKELENERHTEILNKYKKMATIQSKAKFINDLCGVDQFGDGKKCNEVCQSKALLMLNGLNGRKNYLVSYSNYVAPIGKFPTNECQDKKGGKYSIKYTSIGVASFVQKLKATVRNPSKYDNGTVESLIESGQGSSDCNLHIARTVSCQLLNHWQKTDVIQNSSGTTPANSSATSVPKNKKGHN